MEQGASAQEGFTGKKLLPCGASEGLDKSGPPGYVDIKPALIPCAGKSVLHSSFPVLGQAVRLPSNPSDRQGINSVALADRNRYFTGDMLLFGEE